MSYFKKMTGDKVYLSPVNVDDYEKYTKWVNDLETGINVGFAPQIISKGKEKESLEQLAADNNNFAIIENKSNILIGNCGFHNIDTLHRRAEIGIFIGDKEYLGKGYGTDALELLIDYGFNIRNLNSVMLSVREFNIRAIKCYEKIGFKKIGARREACIFGDKRFDLIYMDLLASEFDSNYVQQFLKNPL
jgi:RimJ/RimL family protein N-acetyltransferase